MHSAKKQRLLVSFWKPKPRCHGTQTTKLRFPGIPAFLTIPIQFQLMLRHRKISRFLLQADMGKRAVLQRNPSMAFQDDVRLYPLSDYTRELAESHGVKNMSEFGYDYIFEVLKKNISEEYFDPNDYYKAE